jgi:hypothetical protein
MRYLVVVPISHNGQRIPDGAVVEDGAAYGVRVKSPLPVARLLARGRITAIAAAPEAPAGQKAPAPPAPPPPPDPTHTEPSTESGQKPAQTAAAASDAPAGNRKKGQ